MKIDLITSADLPELNADDVPLAVQLTKLGHTVRPRVWSDSPETDADRIVLRSPWDYHLKLLEFRGWLASQPAERTLNRPAVIEWNIHKKYLLELAAKGLPIVPTDLFMAGAEPAWVTAKSAALTGGFVLKPAISATSYLTSRHAAGDNAVTAAQTLARHGDFLLQPFVQSVAHDGEVSLVFFAGQFSHAVLKRAKSGDYRVQADFGGSAEPFTPAPALIELSQRVLAALPKHLGVPHYARADWVDFQTAPKLSELELIEPNLFFHTAPQAVEHFARIVVREMHH